MKRRSILKIAAGAVAAFFGIKPKAEPAFKPSPLYSDEIMFHENAAPEPEMTWRVYAFRRDEKDALWGKMIECYSIEEASLVEVDIIEETQIYGPVDIRIREVPADNVRFLGEEYQRVTEYPQEVSICNMLHAVKLTKKTPPSRR